MCLNCDNDTRTFPEVTSLSGRGPHMAFKRSLIFGCANAMFSCVVGGLLHCPISGNSRCSCAAVYPSRLEEGYKRCSRNIRCHRSITSTTLLPLSCGFYALIAFSVLEHLTNHDGRPCSLYLLSPV